MKVKKRSASAKPLSTPSKRRKYLLSKVVREFAIDFLDLNLDNRSPDFRTENGTRDNHCIARLIFKHPQQTQTDHAPQGATGLTIDIQNNFAAATRAVPADLEIRPITYNGPHRLAIKTTIIPIRPGIGKQRNRTVKDFLEIFESEKIIPTGFRNANGYLVGCRDVMSQYVFQLEESRLLNAAAENYTDFNNNYGPTAADVRAHAVEHACFNDTYHYHYQQIPNINYTGPRIGLTSHEGLELLMSSGPQTEASS
ncbi:hypothetical protein PENSTE_c007G09776 [Penicillium steckii]|uniref:Uncharacterized protein n=1 Tax=Penicillium steckii TaxID=303698 RepID=A0A1V6TDG8_9EURO|nr:hypothetical protein PENSTE_c007G09776 [Penicillium steckii]